MDFFQKHDKALRKGRLLQAAATIFSQMGMGLQEQTFGKELAVSRAFQLENLIEQQLEKEK